jgi:hypothetical protein
MKNYFLMAMLVGCLAFASCSNADSRYVDLNTGKTVKLEKDESGLMVNAETKHSVDIYVDTKTNDTIYGKTGKVINGHVVRTNDTWNYDADVNADDNGGDYKIKVEKDGDVKIKDGDTKTKIDGETGEKKVKKD